MNIIETCASKDLRNPDKWLAKVPSLVQNIKNIKLLTKGFEGAAFMILSMILESIPISIKRDFLRSHEVSKTGEAKK